MGEYIGLDVSLKDTAISVRRDGKRIWRGKCPSDPEPDCGSCPQARTRASAGGVRDRAFVGVVLSCAPRRGLPAICIDARHAKAALDMAPNKTDANDADGLAHLAEVGFYREVRVKGYDSMLVRTLVAARSRLVQITTELSNQIRGLMKTFGLVVPARQGGTFEAEVRACWSVKTDSPGSSCRCWRPGAACAPGHLPWGASFWPAPGGVRPVSS